MVLYKLAKLSHLAFPRNGCALLAFFTVVSVCAQEPELKVIEPDKGLPLGEPFTVRYQLAWRGDPDDFVIAGPAIDSFGWGTAEPVEVTSETIDDTYVMTHLVKFNPTTGEPGEQQVPAVTFSYFDPETANPPGPAQAETDPSRPDAGPTPNAGPTLDARPTLRASPFSVTLRARRTGGWVSAGLGALVIVLAGAAMALYRTRRGGSATAASTGSAAETASKLVNQARQSRLDGNYYDYFNVLSRAAAELSDPELRGRLEQQAQVVGYQAARPMDDDLDGAMRDVERRVMEARRRELSDS